LISNRLKRAWIASGTVAAAVLALPLLGAGVAQAAIAGANPALTNGRPDLRSATILDARDVQVCFDKALLNTSPGFTNFGLSTVVGYRASNTSAPATVVAAAADNKCFVASFGSDAGDLNQYTAFSIADTSFEAASSGQFNLPDSVTLTGSTTHNGTAGLTVGPNLTGITTPATSTTAGVLGTVTYTFDQTLAAGSPTPSNFFITDVNGNPCFGSSAVQSGSSVVVGFASTGAASCPFTSISDARRGGVLAGTVDAAADPAVGNPLSGQVITTSPPVANGGLTLLPDLTGATLEPDQNTVNYQFSKPINAGTADRFDFQIWLSNGESINPDSIAVAGNNSVNAVFNGLADSVSEYAVLASVDGFAVTDLAGNSSSGPGWTNVPGSAAIGDNAGAFARGFTTGPDAFSVTFNKTASNPFASINLDQRVGSACFLGGCSVSILLLDNNGGVVDSPSSTPITPALEPAGPETVNIPFSSGAFASGTQLLIEGQPFTGVCAFETNLGFPDGCNITQIVRPISSAVTLKAVRLAATYARTHKAHKAHKVHKAHKAHRSHKKH
jgi:hypothetical protein